MHFLASSCLTVEYKISAIASRSTTMQSLVRKELKWASENNLAFQILQAHAPEWALVQRHTSEDIFGIQVCGGSPQQMGRVAQLVEDGHIDCDFVDINLVKKTHRCFTGLFH